MTDSKCKNFIISQGSTPVYQLTVKKNGVATSIVGWTIYLTVKKNREDSDANAAINKKITSHSDVSNGLTQIELDKDDTDLTGNYYFSIDFKDNDENIGVLLWGRINFTDSVRDVKN